MKKLFKYSTFACLSVLLINLPAIAGSCEDELPGQTLKRTQFWQKPEYYIKIRNNNWVLCDSSGSVHICNGRRVEGYMARISWLTDNNGNELRLGNPDRYDEMMTCSVSGNIATEKEIELATYTLPGGVSISKKEVKTRKYQVVNYSF